MKFYESKVLRKLLLPLFARLNPGDITIRHHYTGDRIRIHSFRHKGYWYHGRQRERSLMERFAELIRPGATVLDVGGHTGYTALYFASLVGPQGRVYVFEPGPNNLPYIRHNTKSKSNVTLIEKGAGSRNEQLTLYIEDLTGQNNSFVKDFAVLEENKANAFARGVEVNEVLVDIVTLDDFCKTQAARPDFIKIDVEGFEWQVIQGAESLLKDARPMLMVEIQEHRGDILWLMKQYGYCVLSPTGQIVRRADEMTRPHMNVFCLHEAAHARWTSQFTRAAA